VALPNAATFKLPNPLERTSRRSVRRDRTQGGKAALGGKEGTGTHPPFSAPLGYVRSAFFGRALMSRGFRRSNLLTISTGFVHAVEGSSFPRHWGGGVRGLRCGRTPPVQRRTIHKDALRLRARDQADGENIELGPRFATGPPYRRQSAFRPFPSGG